MPGTGERLDIDTRELARLYVEDRLTLAQVAARLHCSTATVTRRLGELGISRRRRGVLDAHRANAHPPEWSADLAWIVGLLATDGNLSPNGRNIAIVSKDVDLLDTVRRCLNLVSDIRLHRGGFGGWCHRLQWSDRTLYEWLSRVGLMPAKSLRLRALDVPDQWFRDFLRGCIDGDGSITVYLDRQHVRKNDRYVYQRLYVSLVSGSPRFLEWVQAMIERLIGIGGSLSERRENGRRPIWKLRFAKADSIQLIRWMYYDATLPCLARKRRIAEQFLYPVGHGPRGVGRPRVGWLYH